ncbi:MAG: hypothetical protein DWQ42_18450 [Planctomycetota bacterium]|nr:MAG: hypothetical protein DWQ42_18450 [Planctomycetota bacterium]
METPNPYAAPLVDAASQIESASIRETESNLRRWRLRNDPSKTSAKVIRAATWILAIAGAMPVVASIAVLLMLATDTGTPDLMGVLFCLFALPVLPGILAVVGLVMFIVGLVCRRF